jgi:hypothetical protein
LLNNSFIFYINYSSNIYRTTAVQARFYTHNFVCGVIKSNSKIVKLSTLEAKGNSCPATATFSNQDEFAATQALVRQFARWQPLSVSEMT